MMVELLQVQLDTPSCEPIRTVSTFGIVNLQLSRSDNRFTPQATWVNPSTAPLGDWSNLEAFNFNLAFFIRPKLVETDLIYRNGFE